MKAKIALLMKLMLTRQVFLFLSVRSRFLSILMIHFGFILSTCWWLISILSNITGLPSTEDDPDIGKESQTLTGCQVPDEISSGTQLPDESPLGTLDLQSEILSLKELLPAEFPNCILKRKSVFKCRLCPRVVCLNEETLKAHLKCKVLCMIIFLFVNCLNQLNYA